MKLLQLLAMSAAMAALPIFAATEANAQQRPIVTGGFRISPPALGNHFHGGNFQGGGRRGFHNGFGDGFHGGFGGGFGGVWVVDREVPVVVEREVVREVPAAPVAVAPPAPARKPYAIGSTYASLPGSCMKLIDEGVSYYYCGGDEWYKQTGKQYRAVARKL